MYMCIYIYIYIYIYLLCVSYGVLSYDMAVCIMSRYGRLRYGTLWHVTVRYGTLWYVMLSYRTAFMDPTMMPIKCSLNVSITSCSLIC